MPLAGRGKPAKNRKPQRTGGRYAMPWENCAKPVERRK